MNLYGYADGDPINNSDPFGLYVTFRTTGAARTVGRLMGMSPTVRSAMQALMFAPMSEVDLVFQPADNGVFSFMLSKCSDMGGCFSPTSATNAMILYGPSSEQNVGMFAHEIGHAAGWFSKTTGGDPLCGNPDSGVDSGSASISCIRRWEDRVQSEMKAYERRQERQAGEGTAKVPE